MNMASIVATATALPSYYYSQQVLGAALRKYCAAMRLAIELDDITSIFANAGINSRYFAFSIDSLYDPPNTIESLNASIDLTLNLSETVVRSLLEKVKLDPCEISQLTLASLTPAAAPSLDARLMNRIAFSPYLKRMPLVGFGCMGGAAALARAADYLLGHPKEAALVVCAEVPSHMWQGSIQADLVDLAHRLPQDPSLYSDILSTIVTASLFADAAGA
ncbi:MAG: 3-oxoacyl-ACP synthase, partial [Acidobacteriota bacterium]